MFSLTLLCTLFLKNINVYAATLTSYSSNYDACSASNRFTFTNIDTMNNWNYFTGTIGSVNYNVPNSMQFDFKYDLSAMKYYDVKFTMTGYDIYSSVNSSMVSISNGSSCGDLSNNNVALVSFTKSSSSNSRYKVMTFRIYSATAVSNWSILLENTSALAGPENFGVSSITINEVDVSNTDAIIDNQNSNTDSVINNQNDNTNSIINNQNQNNEELKDTINNNFNSCRPSTNLFPGWVIGTGINSTTGAIVTNDSGATSSDYIKVDFNSNSHYTLTGLTTNLRTFIAAYNSNKEFLGRTGANYSGLVTIDSTSFASGTAQGSGDIAYIRITSYNPREGDITQVNDLKTMLNVGSTALDYEEYGKEICTNKLDEQVETSKGILGTLKSVFTSIVELPGKIVNLLVDGLKSLFVPDSEEMNELINNFKNTMSEKLGVIYQAGDLIIDIFQKIIDDTSPENACLTFPRLKLPEVDQAIIEETDFCFNTITDEIPILLTTIRGATGIFITLSFINMLKKKYDDFINGGDL